MRKYEFTGETKVYFGRTLHRIRAVRDFGVKENYFRNVKAGDLGGWIEKESNLSHEGGCWVGENAVVYENAQIFGNAWVFGDFRVEEDTCVFGNARIFGDAFVNGRYAYIYDNAQIFGNAYIYDNAQIFGNAQIYENARIAVNSFVSDNARIFGNAHISGSVRIEGNAQISGKAQVFNNAYIEGNAQILGNADIIGNVHISGDAIVKSMRDYIVFKNWWSSGLYFTWTRSNDKWIDFSFECEVDEWHYNHFHGSGEELIREAYQKSELSGREYERIVKYVESIKKEAL